MSLPIERPPPDKREVMYVVRVKPIGVPSVERARVERRGRTIVTMALPGGSRLLVPADAEGHPRAGGQVRGVYAPEHAGDAYHQALAELQAVRAEIDSRISGLLAESEKMGV